jgi:SAM-dependent methyltransferase
LTRGVFVTEFESGMNESSGPYVLGHSERELDRLTIQARLIEPITRRFFVDAGIAQGMRVLDVGSGVGDVAFLAADLVGEAGEVVGADRAPEALAVARDRAQSRSPDNVSFVDGDPADMTFDRPFDAIVGRYVLLFQPDPAAMLRGLVRHLRPGGVVVFHEPEWARARSTPPVPSWDRCCRLVADAFAAGGADSEMGVKLASVYGSVGLSAPTLGMATVIGAGANSAEQVHFTTDVVVTLLPDIERLGLAAPGEIDPETLADLVLADIAASGSVVVGRSEIGAWSHKEPELAV